MQDLLINQQQNKDNEIEDLNQKLVSQQMNITDQKNEISVMVIKIKELKIKEFDYNEICQELE